MANSFLNLMRGFVMKKIVALFCLVSFLSPVSLYAFDWKNHDLSHLVVVTNRDTDELTIIDMTKDEVIGKQKVAMNSQAHMTAFSPDGKKLAIAATANNKVAVLDLNTNELKEITVGSGPEHMDISKDNRWLYVGNIEGGTVSAIDLYENREVARLKGFLEPHGATIMSSGNKVYIPNRGAQLVGMINNIEHFPTNDIQVGSLVGLASFGSDKSGASMHRERSIPTKGVANVTLTHDEKFAYIATGDANSVTVLDTATDQIVRTIPVGLDPWRAYASPDGKYMIVPNNGDQTISVIDAQSHSLVTTLPGGTDMTGVNFGNNKGYVVSRGSSTVFVYDFSKLKKIGQLNMGETAQLETASTSPAGTKIYVASSSDNSLYVIDVESDSVKQIKDVGSFPWGVSIYKGQNYCH